MGVTVTVYSTPNKAAIFTVPDITSGERGAGRECVFFGEDD
jgi:hypothetical protein